MMECNKEEAIRAREHAEKKMQNKDFVGARKIAQMAQNLFPELENISQMLTVCDVHCSASTKFCGELDWYGILQVETTADDSLIKKHYRKLALLLHPDKNQFAGAEAAFKLIGEANMVLSDKTKRHLYDIKRKVLTRTVAYRQPAPQMRKSYHESCTYSAVNLNSQNHQQQQSSAFATAQTFWTLCPVCGMRYQYYKSILNKSLRCQNCLKTFIAYDLNANVPPSGLNSNPLEQVQVKQACHVNQQNQFNASSSMGFKGSASASAGPNVHFEYRGGRPVNMTTNHKANDKGSGRKEAKFEKNHREELGKSSTANASKKRSRKAAVDSSDSESADSDSTDVEVTIDLQAKNFSSSNAPRRSSRLKQNINYNEVASEDDDFMELPSHKKMRCRQSDSADSHSNNHSVFSDNNSINDKMKSNCSDDASSKRELPKGSKRVNSDARGKVEPDTTTELGSGSTAASNVDSNSKASAEVHAFVYPDPEFCDFDKHRHVNVFAVNQIWSIYDNLDGMPRFYALIRQVYRPHFKLRFTWLEHNPLNDVEASWCNVELPVGCGNFILGSSDSTEDQLMFSHLVSWEKGKKKNSYNIYPTRGEVWALFKDWTTGWSSDADNHRLYEYEVIEVLSDFTDRTGISVVPLVKIDGFVSLFMRAKEVVPYVIPPDEILRFSHNIPTHRLTGTEKEGLPQGCLELDPASLPDNFSESFPSISLCIGTIRTDKLNESSSHPTAVTGSGISRVLEMGRKNKKNQKLSHADLKGFSDVMQDKGQGHQLKASRDAPNDKKQPEVNVSEKDKNDPRNISDDSSNKENSSTTSSRSPIFEYPEAEFHNFEEGKSIDNVQRGQIWALYSDIDKYPKYYGWVKKVELDEFKVHILWLEACPVSVEEKRWVDKGLPITCGTFKVEHEKVVFDNMGIFSHLVKAKPTGKSRYVILPHHGEIWAVYKNWTAGWSRPDFENCEYDVVHISECNDEGISATILTKVDGHRAVYRCGTEGKSVMMKIPADEYIRFSHKIPSFELSHERGGKLRGCWELDTASVPDILLFSDDE